ncbi:MAG TPA: sigma 54-interacting transcriptional regulator, partial [Thermoanaerobaculia bacterium]|nr:sigma 54-interacting transcriptional regulator [Thermoanaerobaculia bacterium]
IFSRVAEAARRVLTFDTMLVNVAHDPDVPLDEPENDVCSVFAVAGDAAAEEIGDYRRSEASPVLRLKKMGQVTRYSDVTAILDSSFLFDRRILALGWRSLVVACLPGTRPLGKIWFASSTTGAYGPEDEASVLAIANLVAVAVGYDRVFRREKERRRRSEALDSLVPTLSRALDIREVFDQLSAAAKQILPHDQLVLALFSDDRKAIRVHASTGESILPDDCPRLDPGRAPDQQLEASAPDPSPERPAISLHPPDQVDWSSFLVRDLHRQSPCCGEDFQRLREQGMRSLLRVPVLLQGGIAGGLTFISRKVGQYKEEDTGLARRIADQIALALSHERLAEEARTAAAARLEAQQLEGSVAALKAQLASRPDRTRQINGTSPSWRTVLGLVSKVAPTETTVLLTGESGTGKEVIARAIHAASPRSAKPFLAINCAALPEHLLESELFGYERGAFTGALQSRAGRIEQAAGGVLFLDEVAEMSPSVQAKFLRVLQEREFQRLGGSRLQKADVRVIAATNRDLPTALARGELREDLYYRLRVFEIALPALRQRRDDIVPLAEAFLEEIGESVGRPCAGISKQAREVLLAHSWPGNVRELRNAIERAIIVCGGGLITAEHLPTPTPGFPKIAGSPHAASSLADLERGLVENALKDARNNKALAARLLGITRSQLYGRIQKHGIS